MDRLGIVFSGRVRSAFLCVMALWILFFLGSSFLQVVSAYFGGGGFDVRVQEFIQIMLLFFIPYFTVAAVLLRNLAARLALFHRLRQQIVVPEYSPPEVLTPAEAGLLADNDFTFNEVAGTLKDLELRGCIGIMEKHREMEIYPLDISGASDIEKQFIQALCQHEGRFNTRETGSSALLLQAGYQLSAATRAQLVAQGLLPKSPKTYKIIRGAFNLAIAIAVFVQLILTTALISNPQQVLQINYPRYPMHSIEPILETLLVVAVLVIAVGGFWQHSLADREHGLKNWRYVAGLRMFIEKVHKDRFYRDGQQMASDGDMRTFYPYALTLGVERGFTDKLKRALLL